MAEARSEAPPVGAAWREGVQRVQQSAMPLGTVVVSCSAPFGVGGLGRHEQEIVAALERRGQSPVRIDESNSEADPSAVRRLYMRGFDTASKPLARLSPGWRLWRASVAFDADAARRMGPADHLIAFNGTALAQFRRAQDDGYSSLSLVSATAHVHRLVARQAQGRRQYPLERSWGSRMARRNLLEYARADRIYVSSDYVRESFLQEGVAEERLTRFPLTPDPRYSPGEPPAGSESFDVVYVGGLTVDKGVPLLVDAVRRLPFADLRLILVGGWKTRGMRRFLERARAADPRIVVGAGDPLPHLRAARLYAHAAYCDGFAYSAAEALACGLPVLASEDTGMKELIEPGRTGLILPTGDLDALTEAISSSYRGEVFGG